jgi:XkdW protein
MTLYEKIIDLYPQLTMDDFRTNRGGTIYLQNDSDGKGDYIAKWEHPTLPKPTQEQLA